VEDYYHEAVTTSAINIQANCIIIKHAKSMQVSGLQKK